MPRPLSPAARELLAARARRVDLIRKRIVAAAVVAFVLAWCVIAYAGPMGKSAATATTSSSGSASSASSDGSVTTSGSWDDQYQGSDEAPAVTTSSS